MSAILPVFTLILGAALSYLFARISENRKQLDALRREAYVDYLRAATKAARATNPDEIWAAKTGLVDAKCRLAVYGNRKVMTALARFEALELPLASPEAGASFLALVSCMRESDAVSEDDLRMVLLGPRWPAPDA